MLPAQALSGEPKPILRMPYCTISSSLEIAPLRPLGGYGIHTSQLDLV
jgi:hypothetical protein